MSLSASMRTRLQYQHETISTLIAGFTEEQLRQRKIPDKWSVFENIAHLAAYQPVFVNRIDRIKREQDPAFERYLAEEDPLFPAYVDKGLEELFRILVMDRSTINRKLAGLDDAILRRTGLHPKFGLLTLDRWIEFFLLHEAHHLFTMFKGVQELH
jgi:hypothetical protein